MSEAVWFSAPGVVELRREALSAPAAHEIRIRAIASAISHGTERLVLNGGVPADLPLDLPTLRGSYGLPIKYGYALVGRVTDVGSAVSDLAVGALVAALHPHQRAANVPRDLVVALPPTLDPVHGTLYANTETALTIVHDAAARFGDVVAVSGLGSVGLLTAQLLLRCGATVIGIEPSPTRRALAQRIGVQQVIAPGAQLAEQLRALSDGRGVDCAIELSGHDTAAGNLLEGICHEGTLLVAAWYGRRSVALPLGGHFHRGRLRIKSTQVGSLAAELQPRWNRHRRSATVTALLQQLELDALISHRFALRDAVQAYQLLNSGADEVTQLVLMYDDHEEAAYV